MERPLNFALAASTLYAAAQLRLSPNLSVLALTLGLLLIYIELNRPGSIVPGAAGLLLSLLAAASILRLHPHPWAALLLLSAGALLAVDLLRPTHILLAIAAAVALVVGFLHLVYGVTPAIAALCGLVLGAGTSLLTRIARRARANKGLDLKGARTSRPGVFKS